MSAKSTVLEQFFSPSSRPGKKCGIINIIFFLSLDLVKCGVLDKVFVLFCFSRSGKSRVLEGPFTDLEEVWSLG